MGAIRNEKGPSKADLRRAELEKRVLQKVADAGSAGAFIPHTGQWLCAERLADRKLLRRRMVCATRTVVGDEIREMHKPRFWLTDAGRAALEGR